MLLQFRNSPRKKPLWRWTQEDRPSDSDENISSVDIQILQMVLDGIRILITNGLSMFESIFFVTCLSNLYSWSPPQNAKQCNLCNHIHIGTMLRLQPSLDLFGVETGPWKWAPPVHIQYHPISRPMYTYCSSSTSKTLHNTNVSNYIVIPIIIHLSIYFHVILY